MAKIRPAITQKVLHEVDKLVLAEREKTPHTKGKPYSAEWLWGMMRHPKTRKLFREEIFNG